MVVQNSISMWTISSSLLFLRTAAYSIPYPWNGGQPRLRFVWTRLKLLRSLRSEFQT